MIMSAMLVGAIRATHAVMARDRVAFDAVIAGAGAAGSLAAMLLTQAGLKVLVLDAGWERPFHRSMFRRAAHGLVKSIADPRWYNIAPPALLRVGQKALTAVGKVRQPVQSKCFAWALAPDAFVDDRDAPYSTPPDRPFDWFRSWRLGGRMTVPGHGQQYYRLSPQEFRAENTRSQPWPFAAEELDAWYAFVEEKLGLEGGDDHSPHQPDSKLSKVVEMSAAKAELRDLLKARWPEVTPLLGRKAPPINGLEAAAETGRLFVRRGAVVKSVEIDGQGKLKGLRWRDAELGQDMTAEAPIVFLCASALESTRILLNSRSPAFPGGIGRESGALGANLMDHVLVSGEGTGGALPGEPVPNQVRKCLYVPRFDLRNGKDASAGVPFGVQLYRSSVGLGRSMFTAVSFGEMAPREDNRVSLHPYRTDKYGVPLLEIECKHDDDDRAVARDQAQAVREIAEIAGVKLHKIDDEPAPPGTAMHECGTARMGSSPKNSVFDPNNECWDVKGLYLTDGACFPSQGAQNPTLTIMALTARACTHAAGRKVEIVLEEAAAAEPAIAPKEFAE